jgi:hypothetical protein
MNTHMNTLPRNRRSILQYTLAAVALIIIGFAIFGSKTVTTNGDMVVDPKQSNEPIATTTNTTLPKQISITGIWECLPVKDPTIPHTMECAFGIEEDGTSKHYAVDTQLMSSTPVDYPTGARLKIDGVMTPVEMLSSDRWQKYDMVGILSATTMKRLN